MGLLCFLAVMLLSACDDEPKPMTPASGAATHTVVPSPSETFPSELAVTPTREPAPAVTQLAEMTPTATPTLEPAPTIMPLEISTPAATSTREHMPAVMPEPEPLTPPTIVPPEISVPAATPTPEHTPAVTPKPEPLTAPTLTPEPTPIATPAPPSPVEKIAALPWVEDGTTDLEGRGVALLVGLTTSSPAGFQRLMLEPWVKDSLTVVEVKVLEELKRIADNPSVQDDRLIADILLLPFLETVEASDLDEMAVFSLPWIEDGIERAEKRYVIELQALVAESADLVKALMALPWVIEGPTATESFGLTMRNFHSMVAGDGGDEATALRIAEMPFLRSFEPADSSVLGVLAAMHFSNPGRLREILFPFRSTGITANVGEIITVLWQEGLNDEFVETMWSLPWVIDGITEREKQVIRRVADVARTRTQLALAVITQDWFTDGVDLVEAAFAATLPSMAESSLAHEDLAKMGYRQHRVVDLPLAGDVNIWIIDKTVPPPNENLLTTIENTVRIAEEFLKEPFPTTDIVLVVGPQGERKYAGHYGSHMVLERHGDNDLQHVPHETAHYYFRANFEQLWLREGGAEFIEAYVNDRLGVRALIDHRLVLADVCSAYGNIVGWENYWEQELKGTSKGRRPGVCDYGLGEKLLLNIMEIIGEDAMVSALRELYRPEHDYWDSSGRRMASPPTEKQVYLAFLKHAPEDRKEAFQDLYRRLHGGAFVSE